MKRFAQVLMAGALATAMWAQTAPPSPAPAGGTAAQTGTKTKVKKQHHKRHHNQTATTSTAGQTK